MRPRLPSAGRLLPYLARIDATRCYSNFGPLTVEFEARISTLLALEPGRFVSASSGTAALVGAILATAGRASKPRPVALVPDFTFAATALAAEQCGYHVELCDVDRETWLMDPDRVQDARLDRVGLVVPVGAFGRLVPQAPWADFQARTDIPVVIDGAACVEAMIRHRSDSFAVGRVPVALSFHATKSLATGEGGGVVSSDTDTIRRTLQALNFGFYESRSCTMASTNGKLSEYHAAVGLAELDEWHDKQAAFAEVHVGYAGHLEQAGLGDRFYGAPGVASCYALFACRDEREAVRVRAALDAGCVGYRNWYGEGLHAQHHFAQVSRGPLPNSRFLSRTMIGLPMAVDLPESSIQRVVGCLVSAVRAPREVRAQA